MAGGSLRPLHLSRTPGVAKPNRQEDRFVSDAISQHPDPIGTHCAPMQSLVAVPLSYEFSTCIHIYSPYKRAPHVTSLGTYSPGLWTARARAVEQITRRNPRPKAKIGNFKNQPRIIKKMGLSRVKGKSETLNASLM